MKHPIVKSIIAILGGVVLSNVLILIIENLGTRFYTLPAELQVEGAELMDPAAREAYMQAWAEYMPNAPLGLLLFPLAAWAVGAFAGSWLAARLAPSRAAGHGAVIGLLILLGTIYNLNMIAHPGWMWIAGPLVVIAGAWLGIRLAGKAEA